MNPEQQPRDPLEAIEVHGESLRYWHKWLTTDEDTGEYTGHLLAPGSRYGRNAEDCAWWAVAAETIYVDANGNDDAPKLSLGYFMGLAVNDSEHLADMVLEYWHAVPRPLRRMLGTKAEVRELLS